VKIRKQRKLNPIPLASMGDIAFLLLVFYMATTLVTDQKPRDIELPELVGYSQNAPYPLVVYLDRELALNDNAFFFNRVVHYSELPALVQERAAGAPVPPRVYLNVQKDLPYRHTHQVLGMLKKAGVRNLVITTRPPEGTRLPPGQGAGPR
jgi:biopolymer transport protein ExbD